MADYVREIDHYEVIVEDNGMVYAIKEFFAEDEAIAYAKRVFEAKFSVTVKEVSNVIWW